MNRRIPILACVVLAGVLAVLVISRTTEAEDGAEPAPHLTHSLAEIEDFRRACLEFTDACSLLLFFVDDSSLALRYERGLEGSREAIWTLPVDNLDQLMRTGFDPRSFSRDVRELADRLSSFQAATEGRAPLLVGSDPNGDPMFPEADLSFCTPWTYGETQVFAVIYQYAAQLRKALVRAFKQTIVAAVGGGNAALLAIPVDIAFAVFESFQQSKLLCAGAQDGALLTTSYDRLEYLKGQIGQNTDTIEKLKSEGLELYLADGTILASLYLPEKVGETEIGGRLEEVMELVRTQHDASVAAGINTHYAPFHINRAMERYELGQWRKCYEDLVRAYSWMTFTGDPK